LGDVEGFCGLLHRCAPEPHVPPLPAQLGF
jgi:hypothetical protein